MDSFYDYGQTFQMPFPEVEAQPNIHPSWYLPNWTTLNTREDLSYTTSDFPSYPCGDDDFAKWLEGCHLPHNNPVPDIVPLAWATIGSDLQTDEMLRSGIEFPLFPTISTYDPFGPPMALNAPAGRLQGPTWRSWPYVSSFLDHDQLLSTNLHPQHIQTIPCGNQPCSNIENAFNSEAGELGGFFPDFSSSSEGNHLQQGQISDFSILDQPQHPKKRKRRCLNCTVDKGKRSCAGYPVCQRCGSDSAVLFGLSTPAHTSFFDWNTWSTLRQDLLHSTTRILEKYTKASRWSTSGLEPVVLHLDFEDRAAKEDRLLTNTVILQSSSSISCPKTHAGTDHVSPRAPAIDGASFDVFVDGPMWGSRYADNGDCRMNQQENALFKTLKLFIGYFWLLHNLSSISVSSTVEIDGFLSTFVASELVYFLALRSQELFAEVMRLCETVKQSHSGTEHSSSILYALDTVYRIVASMQPCNWGLHNCDSTSPLAQLQTEFKRCSSNMLTRILAQECYLSGMDVQSKRTRKHPLRIFAHARPKKTLPTQLTIYAERQRPILYLSDPFPNSDPSRPRYSVIDLVLHSGRDHLLSQSRGSFVSMKKIPMHLVNADNTKITSFKSLCEVSLKSQKTPVVLGKLSEIHTKSFAYNHHFSSCALEDRPVVKYNDAGRSHIDKFPTATSESTPTSIKAAASVSLLSDMTSFDGLGMTWQSDYCPFPGTLEELPDLLVDYPQTKNCDLDSLCETGVPSTIEQASVIILSPQETELVSWRPGRKRSADDIDCRDTLKRLCTDCPRISPLH